MKTKLLLILTFFTLCLSAQDRKPLQGVVTIGDARVPGVFIINKNSGQEAKTDGQGNFSIPARNGDKLAVHSSFTEDREFYINNDSFKKMPYVLAVEGKTTQLEEVVVADSIKIIQPSKDVAVYTQGERKVNTGAKVTTHAMDYAGGGIAVSTDAVLNGADKRRALRRELTTEQLQKNITAINSVYSNERITEALGIPADRVEAFLYYAAEDPELGKTLKEGNTDRNRTILSSLAARYLEMQAQPEPATNNPQSTTKDED
jgi:hypothetical protein